MPSWIVWLTFAALFHAWSSYAGTTSFLPKKVAKPPVAAPTTIPPTLPTRPGPPVAASAGSGGTMQECGIPAGPVAYNIGNPSGTGIGNSCQPSSIVVGFNGNFSKLPRGTTGIGYINPRLENDTMVAKFPGNTKVIGDEWDEPVYKDYASDAAVNYISYQVNHWKAVGRSRGQKCVAVDVDNCDVIGSANYGKVLDTIDKLNRDNPEVQIRVLVKNPQNAGCHVHLKRKVAVGAFMEELSTGEFNTLNNLRANPNQILVFARGNTRNSKEHISMDAIANSGVPNSTVSFDGNGSYNYISRCTYNAGANLNRSASLSQQESTVAR